MINNLLTIHIDELEKSGILTCDLLIKLGTNNKCVTVLRAGEYVIQSFIEKYRIKGIQNFYFDSNEYQASNNEKNEWKKMWSDIKDAQDLEEPKLIETINGILTKYNEIFFQHENNYTHLNFISETHKAFLGLSHNSISNHIEKNSTLFRRSMVLASHAMPLIISLGYYDLNFIKDSYNAILLLAFHLSNNDFTITFRNSLTLESIQKGLGLEYLNKISPLEVNKFTKFIVENEDMFQSDYKFEFLQIKDLTYFFQKSLKSEDLSIGHDTSDWITAVFWLNKIIPYDDELFKIRNANLFMAKLLSSEATVNVISNFNFKKIINNYRSFWKVPRF